MTPGGWAVAIIASVAVGWSWHLLVVYRCVEPAQDLRKWNRPEHLFPVGMWVLIRVNGDEIKVKRRTHLVSRSHRTNYYTETGACIIGAYEWSYI
jgi:hypothetical protein